MIENSIEFEKFFDKTFTNVDRTTLVNVNEKVRFELGGEGSVSSRINQALYRSNQILNSCFKNSSIWLRIILWSENSKENLHSADFNLSKLDLFFEDYVNKEKILYIKIKKFETSLIQPVLLSLINFENNRNPSSDITCFFVDFEKRVIANIYDDRGMDVLSFDSKLFKQLMVDYGDWIIQ